MYKNKIGIGFYLKRHKYAVIFEILSAVFACVFSTASTLLFANFLAKVTVRNFDVALKLLIFAGSCMVMGRVCWWFNAYVFYKYSNILWKEIAKDLTKRSFCLSTSTFSDNNSGAFITRIMDDPKEVISKMSSLIDMIVQIVSQVVVIIYIISLHWIIALLYIAMLTLSFILEMYRRKINKKNISETKKINDKTYSLVKETVESETDIKALGLEEELYNTINNSFNKFQKQKYKEDIFDVNIWNTRNVILEVFGLFVLGLGIYLMNERVLTMATYILLYSYRNELYGFVWNVGNMFRTCTQISVSNSRMFSLYDDDLYPAEKFGDKNLEKVKGKIQFEKVEFAYVELKENEEQEKTLKNKKKIKKQVERIKKEPIFKNLSFTIKPNSTVAFVGKSGSGKSTILSLISKLNDVDKGIVKIDGTNIKEISKSCLRDNISLINQFPYIFDMTIKENLLLVKNDATEEELWQVLKRASFDEDVQSMPKGINTKVGESGVKLSGGQRQRLAIARALLKESKIILFDESTSSLDNFAQSKIQQSIENMKGQHTIVIVAHRLSTIRNVDTIYFLENGKITASGTFDELFETNEQFKNMFLIENIETKN